MIQIYVYNRICTMYNVYSYSRRGENLVLVLKCHEKERKLGRLAMVEIEKWKHYSTYKYITDAYMCICKLQCI